MSAIADHTAVRIGTSRASRSQRRRRTSQTLAVVALSVGFSLTSHGAKPAGQVGPDISQDAIDALTALEGIPSVNQLQDLIPENTVAKLEQIAIYDPGDSNGTTGGAPNKEDGQTIDWRPLRIRAIRALAQFDPPAASTQQLLRNIVQSNLTETVGIDVLLSEAALESLGHITAREASAQEKEAITKALQQSQSRDVRVAAARALSQIGNPDDVEILRSARGAERVPAVEMAILEAIRILSENP